MHIIYWQLSGKVFYRYFWTEKHWTGLKNKSTQTT